MASRDRNPLFATGSPRPGGRHPIARGPSVALGSARPRLGWLEELFPLLALETVHDRLDFLGAPLRADEKGVGGVDDH